MWRKGSGVGGLKHLGLAPPGLYQLYPGFWDPFKGPRGLSQFGCLQLLEQFLEFSERMLQVLKV